MSFWRTAIVLFLIAILGAGVFYYIIKPRYPAIVNIYEWRYNQMSTLEGREELINYSRLILNDPIEGLNYLELLEWEHRHLEYMKVAWDKRNQWWFYEDWSISYTRPELPIPILERGKGPCGEFSLLYTGLCLANGIPVRLVNDCSIETDNRSTADHVWNEVYVNGSWMHVDPTENKVNEPHLYRDQWNKNINQVYAIDESGIVDVTDKYA